MSAQPQHPSFANGQRQPRILSCVLCQRRKIKCDRTIPCSNCVKANVTCTPSTPAPPRVRSKPRKDLQDRLARCESLLRQYVDKPELTPPSASTGSAPSFPAAVTPASKTYAAARTPTDGPSPVGTPGRMFTDTGNARFVDGQLWQTLSDEIQVMRDIIDSEDPEGSSFNTSEDGAGDTFDQYGPPHCPHPGDEAFKPMDAVQIFKLWQIFLDRVNPLIKIIHAPTVQPYIVQAASDMESIPLNYQGLLYSIFGLSSIALNEDELLQITSLTRSEAIRKFTYLSSQSLVKFDFLRRYEMVTVQALLHTLILLQTEFNRHAAWVLSGSLIRIAISLGYHRDGTTLNLTPFETEMRRRIWWQIVLYDLKLTVTCGLKHHTIPGDFDTRPPLNLNDADMFPESAGELQSREGPTEMGFMLVINRLTQHFLDEEARLTVEANIIGQGPWQGPEGDYPRNPESLERNIRLLDELDTDLQEIETRFLSAAAGNAHTAALKLRVPVVRGLRDMLTPMDQQPEWGTEIFGPRDNFLKQMTVISETFSASYAPTERWGFAWFVKSFHQVEMMTGMVSMLYQRPTGSLADRSWRVLDSMFRFHTDLFDLTPRAHMIHAQFTLKAFDKREREYAAMGQQVEVPDFVVQLRQKLRPETAEAEESMVNPAGVMGFPGGEQQMPIVFGPDGQPQEMGMGSFQGLSWDFLAGMGTDGLFGGNQQYQNHFQ